MDDAFHLFDAAAVVVLLGLLYVVQVLLAKRMDDPFGLFVLVFGVFYGFRATLIGLGVDTPTPDSLFLGQDQDGTLIRTLFGLCVYLAAFLCSGYLISRRPSSSPGILFHSGHLPIQRLVFVTYGLTAFSVVISGYLLLQFGGFGGLVHASKVDNDLAGLRYLRLPSSLGALVGAGAYLDLRRMDRGTPIARLLVLSCAVLNSILIFSWGQRTVVIIVVAMLVIGPRGREPKSSLPLIRVLVAAVLVIVIAVFLRDTRDDFLQPGETHSFAQQSLSRRPRRQSTAHTSTPPS